VTNRIDLKLVRRASLLAPNAQADLATIQDSNVVAQWICPLSALAGSANIARGITTPRVASKQRKLHPTATSAQSHKTLRLVVRRESSTLIPFLIASMPCLIQGRPIRVFALRPTATERCRPLKTRRPWLRPSIALRCRPDFGGLCALGNPLRTGHPKGCNTRREFPDHPLDRGFLSLSITVDL